MARCGRRLHDPKRIDNVLYPVEESRGYQAHGDLWSPGAFRLALTDGTRATLVASTEAPETMNVLEPTVALGAERIRRERLLAQAVAEAREGLAAELVIAADQFVIAPAGRTGEIAARAPTGTKCERSSPEPMVHRPSRDTMISLRVDAHDRPTAEAGWLSNVRPLRATASSRTCFPKGA